MSDKEKLMFLRVQLYAGMQLLKGDDLKSFWALIDEINDCRDMYNPTESDGGKE